MPLDVCPRCGQSLYWCGESGVCEMGGVMEKFTASNGVEIAREGDEDTYQAWNIGNANRVLFAPHEFEALREFFQHERDQELGRWRWPENPDYVVYQRETEGHAGSDYQECAVVNEVNGFYQSFGSDLPACHGGEYREAARAYFAAHPEPKPWHDAKPGEVWELTYRSPSQRETSNRVMACVDDGGNISFFNEYRLHTVHYTGIESGRRVWPEVS